jgi:hypothetical protein
MGMRGGGGNEKLCTRAATACHGAITGAGESLRGRKAQTDNQKDRAIQEFTGRPSLLYTDAPGRNIRLYGVYKEVY